MRKLILILFLGLFLYGDVMYEMMTTTEGMMGTSESKMHVYVKGNRSRTEITSESQMTGEFTNITITRLDKNVIWTLDLDNKQYSEIKLGETTESKGEKSKEETDIDLPEIKVEKTGKKKKILGKTCEEVIVSMDVKSTEGDFTMTQILWVTKDIASYKEIEDFNDKLSDLGANLSTSPMGLDKKSFDEFQEKISEIEGFPLEFDMNISIGAEDMSFSMKMHSTITKIDTKPINEKIFEIPAGYTLKK